MSNRETFAFVVRSIGLVGVAFIGIGQMILTGEVNLFGVVLFGVIYLVGRSLGK